MNNEEKILSILESMQQDIGELKTGVAKLDDRVARLDDSVAKLDDRVANLDGRVANLEVSVERLEVSQAKMETSFINLKSDMEFVRGSVVRIEQVHGKKLDSLGEGYEQLADKMARIEEHVGAQDDFILKRVFPQTMNG